MDVYILQKSTRKTKKWMVRDSNGRLIHFGADGYEDFTQHGNEDRRQRYLARHRSRENWTDSGINTAGFWAKWLLWNKPTLSGSIRDIQRKFGIKIRRK